MRIIAGKHRGRKLVQFLGKDVRPTPDRVKESLFQILSPRLSGARVLDLFAGSGALGLESLSRGASAVTFNDLASDSLNILKKNLALLKEQGEVKNLDYKSCLMQVTPHYDLIFADPPYAMDCCRDVLGAVAARNLLTEGGLVVYESEREESPVDGWTLFDRRVYGRTKIFFFERSLS